MTTFFAITLTLFFVIDALGNLPTYLSLFKHFEKKKQRMIAIRELIFALIIMLAFHFVGQGLLTMLGISKMTVEISGGLILLIIAIRLIFSQEDEKPKWEEKEPFIVPIATPIIAGPSLLSVIMIFAQDEDLSTELVLGAIVLAWFASSIIFLFGKPIFHVFKEKGLIACQRLMGMIVALIAVQMLLLGIKEIVSR